MTDILKYLVYFIILAVALYVLSRIQMKAWLDGVESFFLNQYKSIKHDKENQE